MSKSNLKLVSSKKTEEFNAADFAFHMVEVIAGKKAPIGLKTECVKAGINRYGGKYCIIIVDDAEQFADPKNLKVLKPIAPAAAAAIKAEQEEASTATLIVSGTIKNETDGKLKKDGTKGGGAVLISHHGWFKAKWFPKAFVTKLGDHEDGEQSLYEVPRWKIANDLGPDGVKALEALQEGFEKMLQPKAVVGKSTLIKRKVK